MTWDEYYEKINDWAVSTAVNKMSSLEDMGTSDEVVDALNVIAFEDKKGADRLLNRALQHGIKFSGDNLVEIGDLCSEDSFRKAFYQSADAFTAQDLEDMSGCIDDKMIIDVVKKYHISAPEDIAEEYEEELCPDVTTPISWSRFYNAFYEWSRDYAIARSRALQDFGEEDDVIEVANELFGEDQHEASQFIQRAVLSGVKFNEDNLFEISSLCDAKTIRQAVITSGPLLNEDSLEELYGIIDDDVIIEVAKLQKLQLPEYMREECDEEDSDLEWEVQSAIEAADYALQCLYQAQAAMDASSNISGVDMLSKGFFASFLKHTSLEEAEQEIRIAQDAIEDLNNELKTLLGNKSVQLKAVKLSSAIDMWFDSDFMDCLVHMQINKVRKNIRRAIAQVETIRRELERL